jgi:hypothetical protein
MPDVAKNASCDGRCTAFVAIVGALGMIGTGVNLVVGVILGVAVGTVFFLAERRGIRRRARGAPD